MGPLKVPRTEEPGGLQSMELQRVGHDWACAHTLQSETRTGVPAAPLSGLSPCVIQCPGVSSMNYFLHWTTAAPMWTCSAGHYKLRAQGEASKTPALPRVSKTQVQRNPVLMTSGMEGREQAGFRTQHQARAVMGAASGGLVAHLRNG